MVGSTKKDFELVARAINRAMKVYADGGMALPRAFVALVIKAIADEFATSNRNFNRTMFYRAVTKDIGPLLKGTLDE